MLWAVAALYAAISGLWVIYDGRHWFTDAMGGYLYETFYTLVLIVVYERTKGFLATRPPQELLGNIPRLVRRPVEYVSRLVA